MKLSFISLCILVIFILCLTSVSCQLRFKDDEMMKKHHNHANLQKQGAPMITVHLIPHSHDDVGWLKTVDDYYYGGDMSTQMAGVQYTIDSVVEQLSKNSTYKFSIVEVAFLYRWWNQANATQRNKLKTLYTNGQIQFLNGGWCMSDEAAPYYEDVIDQMTIGHRWLKQTFGAVPTAAWHIDPFGHQSSSASMFSQMGMQAFFFARIDYQDKNIRLENKAMEMLWKPFQYNGEKSTNIFTHVNYYHYSPPPGFCFDVRCVDQPIKDNPELGDYNLPSKADTLVHYFKSMSQHFRSSNLMHTLGEDFHYIDGNIWFKNVDKLINYINSKSAQYGMTIKYSTPSEYITTIQKQGNKYPTKQDDFFPYADVQHGYWTGYFTSRTALKGFIRELGKNIQSLRKHVSELSISNTSSYINSNKDKIESIIWQLQMAQGILQHHDAVAGTSKQKVAYDYINTALKALAKAKSIYSSVRAEQIKKQIGQQIDSSTINFNLFWNQTAQVTGIASLLAQNKNILIQLYNPGPKGTYQIKLRVPSADLNIVGSNNQAIQGDVICPNTIGYQTNQCQLIFDLTFEEASNNYVKIMKTTSKATASAKLVDLTEFRIVQKSKTFYISNTANITLERLTFLFNLQMKIGSQSFTIGYKYYENYAGSGQKGGAYIFRPASDTPKVLSNIKKIYSAQGAQTLVIVLQGTSTLTKLYFSRRPDYVQNNGFQMVTWLDSISIEDDIGKQVCLSFKTSYDNNNEFYTDSNGLQEQYRKINYRPTWNLTVNQAVAGNYYPINSHIKMIDSKSKKSLTLLTDRSMGGAVINKGQIQLLIHRRLLHDDWRGVDQNLNQTQVINGKEVGLTQSIRHYVVFGDNHRTVQKQNDQKILINLAASTSNQFISSQIRGAPLKVPDNVKLYLRPMFNSNSYLFRLHNFDTKSPASVIIPDGWKVIELTLSANQQWAQWSKKQYKWNEESTEDISLIDDIEEMIEEKVSIFGKWINKKNSIPSATQINLRPFDMRTYKLEKA